MILDLLLKKQKSWFNTLKRIDLKIIIIDQRDASSSSSQDNDWGVPTKLSAETLIGRHNLATLCERIDYELMIILCPFMVFLHSHRVFVSSFYFSLLIYSNLIIIYLRSCLFLTFSCLHLQMLARHKQWWPSG